MTGHEGERLDGVFIYFYIHGFTELAWFFVLGTSVILISSHHLSVWKTEHIFLTVFFSPSPLLRRLNPLELLPAQRQAARQVSQPQIKTHTNK